jgi:WD40 repeat protein
VLVAAAAVAALACGGDDDGMGPRGSGTVEVTATTTGAEPDADGYTVTLGTESMAIGVSETVTFWNVSPGAASAELSGLSFTCDVASDNPVSVTVTAGETATAGFDVSCPPPQLAFFSDRQSDVDIFIMYSDGTQVSNLSNNPATETFFAWSPDGSQILFVSDRDGNSELYVMDADGSNQTNLTNHVANDTYGEFSPDGIRIAFTSHRDVNSEICIMNANGSDQTRVTNNPALDAFPRWRP